MCKQINYQATLVEGQGWLDGRASDWERFLRWSYASYGWTEEVVVKRAGVAPSELEFIALSRGKSRNRPMAPTYVLAVDHGRKEIVLSVRGTKAFGDAITITHFRPEPFLGGYAHRGFAQSAHELVKQVEPQLTSLAERLPDYRVCFTGHSMGGGIAAMASMLLRDSADRRHKLPEQQQQQQHSSSAAGGAESTPNPDSFDIRNEGGEGREAALAAATGRTAGMQGRGTPPGPTVYSFATPACVSLELARGCEGWVDSIVHGDDAIPRLSTVSLELLKEDMTAAEWRRAKDRLAHLNTVLSPSTKAAAAAAAAIKNALARVGALRKAGGPERTGSVGEDAANADSGREQQFAATAVSDDDIGGNGSGGGGGGGDEFVSSDGGWREERDAPSGGFRATATGAEAPTAVLEAEREAATRRGAAPASSSFSSSAADAAAAAARTGAAEVPAETERRADRGAGARTVPCADGAEEETDRKRNDLGRSVRDTALAMRGLARLYPLSQSFSQEIATIVSQVVNHTGGEQGDGAGAIITQKDRALSHADRADDDNNGGGRLAEQPTSTDSGGGEDRDNSSTSTAAARGGDPKAQQSGSRPELLLTLKENLESLGESRAALKRDISNGAGRGNGGSRDEGDNKAGVRRHDPGAAARGGGGGGAAAATAPADADAVADRVAGVAVTMGTEPAGGYDSSSFRRKKTAVALSEGGRTLETIGAHGDWDGDGGDVDGSNDGRLRCLHESYLARPEPSLLPLYPPGDAFLVCHNGNDNDNGNSSNGVRSSSHGDGDGMHYPPQPRGDEQGEASEQTLEATAAAAAAAASSSPMRQAGGYVHNNNARHAEVGGPDDTTVGAAAAAGEVGSVVLMRVPHEHFLRMPLSPSMLEDHSISSYQRALAGLPSKIKPGGV